MNYGHDLHLLSRGIEQLLGRFSGPLNFRLFVMPTVVTFLAIRADRRDARENRPGLLGAFFIDPIERRRLFRSAVKDIGRIFLVALVLDTTYQLWICDPSHWSTSIVAVVCAVVPYVLVRGPITRLVRLLFQKKSAQTAASAAA